MNYCKNFDPLFKKKMRHLWSNLRNMKEIIIVIYSMVRKYLFLIQYYLNDSRIKGPLKVIENWYLIKHVYAVLWKQIWFKSWAALFHAVDRAKSMIQIFQTMEFHGPHIRVAPPHIWIKYYLANFPCRLLSTLCNIDTSF